MRRRREEASAEAAVAAGGLRRPPTKSPDRIPFGFRPPLRRVNNVFTRRFASFAVRPPRSVAWAPSVRHSCCPLAGPSSSSSPSPPPPLSASLPNSSCSSSFFSFSLPLLPRFFFLSFSLLSISFSFFLLFFFLTGSIFLCRDRAILGHRMRPACCTFHGCLQLRIMNIDNSGGSKKARPSNVNISTTFRALATRAFFSSFSVYLGISPFVSFRCDVGLASFR